MANPPMPASAADRAAWRTNAMFNQAVEHIRRIYDTRILYVYGLGLVANAVSDLFNHFLHLRPVPVPEKDTGEMVFKAVGLLKHLPVVGETLEIPLQVAEGAYDLAKKISPNSSSPAADVELDETLRHEEIAIPLFQRILWKRWDLEQQKSDAIERFNAAMVEKSQDSQFSGTPLTLAKEMFGEAPAKLDRDAIYKLFLQERDRVFKSVMIQYVRKYVSIFRFEKQTRPGGPDGEMVYYSIRGGLNDAQWRFMYSRFGTKPDPKERLAVVLRMFVLSLPTSKVSKNDYNFSPAPNPILNDLSDLWKLWGAKLVVWQQTWYGSNSITDRPGVGPRAW